MKILTHLVHSRFHGLKAGVCFVLGAALALSASGANAVFLYSDTLADGTPWELTMTVGSPLTGVVNKVTFDVTGSNVSSSSTPVTGTTDAPLTSVTNGVGVTVATSSPKVTGNPGAMVTLTVDSSAGFPCVAGTGCGTAIIPASTVSWVSYEQDTSKNLPGTEIQDGAFTGSGSQQLASFRTGTPGAAAGKGSVTLYNVLVFSYDNATLYPAGTYSGRITFTASLL